MPRYSKRLKLIRERMKTIKERFKQMTRRTLFEEQDDEEDEWDIHMLLELEFFKNKRYLFRRPSYRKLDRKRWID